MKTPSLRAGVHHDVWVVVGRPRIPRPVVQCRIAGRNRVGRYHAEQSRGPVGAIRPAAFDRT